MIVLALNTGSSSLKYGLYDVAATGMQALSSGELASAMAIADLLRGKDLPAPDAIGHRVVHGGPRLQRHQVVSGAVLAELEAAAAFAPLHTPAALSAIRFVQAQCPALPQVVCFDTSFHAALPDVARVLPLPRELLAEGVRRYGFHGLSCESVLAQLGADLPSRVVIAHLGNGASVTAVRDGLSVDTSMGLTPSGGLVMGSRSGDLDPGVLLYLMREKKLGMEAIETLIDSRSGLLGISGLSSDMRQLQAAAPGHADADLAIRMFCRAVGKQIAGMATVLDGLDLIVFTGGIGEKDAAVRRLVCNSLSCLGVTLDEERNQRAARHIAAAGARCAVQVLPCHEDAQIARHCHALLQRSHG